MIYAVNKRTKEHEVMDPNALYNTAVWEEVHADPDGWIEWQGGECPLPDGGTSEIRMSNGDEFLCDDPEEMAWGDSRRYENIIAYRPMLDARASRPGTLAGPDKHRADGGEPPAWDGDVPPVGCECEVSIDGDSHAGGRVIAYHEDMVWIDLGGRHPVRLTDRCHFRPIRSEEDRITEELERIMYKPAMTREMAARIYEAIRDGKVPGVKLTGGEV